MMTIQIIEEAKASCEVTHAHPDAQAGTIAIAIAGAYCVRQRLGLLSSDSEQLLETVIKHTPKGDTRSRIQRAINISADSRLDYVISLLGNGSTLCSYDTVPIALWFVANSNGNFEARKCTRLRRSSLCELVARSATCFLGLFHSLFEDTLWHSVAALGDRDTIGAIVGSLMALIVGKDKLPITWCDRR